MASQPAHPGERMFQIPEYGAEKASLHYGLCPGGVEKLRLLNQVNEYSECLEICVGMEQRGPHCTIIYVHEDWGVSGY